MRKCLQKLRKNNGESIGEVLVALLISVLSMTLLASMIAASVSLTRSSKEKLSDYYAAQNTLENKTAASVDGSVTFTDNSGNVKLTDGDIEISIRNNGQDGKEEILSYAKK